MNMLNILENKDLRAIGIAAEEHDFVLVLRRDEYAAWAELGVGVATMTTDVQAALEVLKNQAREYSAAITKTSKQSQLQ